MSNILSKIPNILTAEDAAVVQTFLETEERMHKQLKEHNKKEKLEKKREAKEAMMQKCMARWAETEEYKKYIN